MIALLLADLILINGTVHTVDSVRPRAEAVAASEGRIVYVGDTSGALKLKGPKTRVVDLRGRTVVPGLIDAHGHVTGLGFSLVRLDVTGTSSPDEIAQRVRARAAAAKPGQWILGRGWDQNDWPQKAFPSRKILDAASPDVPVALTRIDGHAVWANSRAIQLAGITARTPDPPGGRIEREPSGEPAGVFVDAAEALIEAKIPDPTREETREVMRAGMQRCLRSGLTGVHDAGVSALGIDLYRELLEQGDFPFRIDAMLQDDADLIDAQLRAGPMIPAGVSRLGVRSVKLYIDGALGSRGAALLAPYSDAPDLTGLLVTEPSRLREVMMRAARGGFQTCVHAIGDRGNRLVLDAAQEVVRGSNGADLRIRIEHAQTLSPEDIPRFARLGVIASVQPTHATSDMPWAADRLGNDRVRGAYAWRSLLDAGARLACGSDFPVESERPLLGFYAAITRRDPQGRPPGGWFPEQRLTRQEALRCFTLDAAYAAFQEDRRGSIAVGKLADMTVLSDDIMEIPESRIPGTEVVMTIVGGQVAHEAP